jgi:hypothetical protein
MKVSFVLIAKLEEISSKKLILLLEIVSNFVNFLTSAINLQMARFSG